MLFYAIVADDSAWGKNSSQELQIAYLSMADVKDSEAFKAVQTRGSHRHIIVHLKLKNVRALTHLTENAHDNSFSAQKGIPTV